MSETEKEYDGICQCGHRRHAHFDETRWCSGCECERYRLQGQRLRDLIIPEGDPDE